MNSCEKCKGKCCIYVTVKIQDPDNVDVMDHYKWLVMHKNVIVYQDIDQDWQVEFQTRCKHLGKHYRCKIYKTRPIVCREYNPDECHGMEPAKKIVEFRSPDDVENYFFRKSSEIQKLMMFFNVVPADADIGERERPIVEDDDGVSCCKLTLMPD